MRACEEISETAYRGAMARLSGKAVAPRRSGRGGPSAVDRAVRERGRAFVSLVADAMARDLITANDASAYLGVKLKHLEEAVTRAK
jgi:hypothetical protein